MSLGLVPTSYIVVLSLCTRFLHTCSIARDLGKSKHKGVNWSKHHDKWEASTTLQYHQGKRQVRSKRKHLGYFGTEEEAAQASRAAAAVLATHEQAVHSMPRKAALNVAPN